MNGPVGIVGAGYVGLPLAQVFAEAGQRVVLVESNPEKVEHVQRGESYVKDVSSRLPDGHGYWRLAVRLPEENRRLLSVLERAWAESMERPARAA